MPRDIFDGQTVRGWGQVCGEKGGRVEAKAAAEHLPMHGTAPHSKGSPSPNLAGAQIEELSPRG